MEFPKTKNKLNELSIKFEDELKNLVSSHKKTGKLESSITTKVTISSDKYVLTFSALKYIEYLDDGKLLKNFIKEKKKELKEEISKTITSDIRDSILKDVK